MQYKDLLFGLLDFSSVLLVFLPVFGQRTAEGIRAVSLLALTDVAPYLKAVYLGVVASMLAMGILTLALQNCQNRFWKTYKHPLSLLLNGFKNAVGEAPLTQLEWSALRKGIEEDRITYYIAWQGERAVGVFSLCRTFSSFRCAPVGLFEDFYVLPDVRGTGVARVLAQYARTAVESIGGKTLTVTCAECDREMYQSLGFTEPIGITLSQTL
jgi:GNAT superfamily N-acetyltransferase